MIQRADRAGKALKTDAINIAVSTRIGGEQQSDGSVEGKTVRAIPKVYVNLPQRSRVT